MARKGQRKFNITIQMRNFIHTYTIYAYNEDTAIRQIIYRFNWNLQKSIKIISVK